MTLTELVEQVWNETNNPSDQSQRATDHINMAFSQVAPKLQLSWDSSSYGNLQKCPRFYELNNVEGYVARSDNDHIKFGHVFHGATETYTRQRANGANHDAGICAALRYAIAETWDFDLNRPWLSVEPTKTRYTLLRTIVWYLDQFEHDAIETLTMPSGDPAVELGFRFSLSELDPESDFSAPTGEEYALCGRLDRVARWNDKVWIQDKKSTKYQLDDTYFRQYSPDCQVSLYTIAGRVIFGNEIDGIMIDAAQVLVEGSRFARRTIERTDGELERWLVDLKIRLRENEAYVANNHWPMNDKACGWGRARCQYVPVCTADPIVHDEILKQFYKKRVWNPLERPALAVSPFKKHQELK